MRETPDPLFLFADAQINRGLCCGLPAAHLPSALDTRGSLQNVLCNRASVQSALPDDATVQEAYTAMIRSLNPLLENEAMRALTGKLINEEPIGGWGEDELRGFPEWLDQTSGQNRILLLLGELCRAGAFTYQNGYWVSTDFCERIRFVLTSPDSLCPAKERLLLSMTTVPGFLNGWLGAIDQSWQTLSAPHSREILRRLIEQPCGRTHDQVKACCANDDGCGNQCSEAAVRTMSAAAGVGAVWYSGYTWMPTLYGLWLSEHPQSPLNAERRSELTF